MTKAQAPPSFFLHHGNPHGEIKPESGLGRRLQCILLVSFHVASGYFSDNMTTVKSQVVAFNQVKCQILGKLL